MSSKRSTPRRTKRLAAAILAAGSLLTGQQSVHAQSPDGIHQAQATRTAHYDIPAQPLAQALTALGQQAGLQLAVSAPVVAGKTSSAVSGVMTAEQALRQLLAGTGVSYRFTSPSSVTVTGSQDSSGAMQLDPVQVQAAYLIPSQAMIDNIPPPYAGGQVATGGQLGLLGNRSVMDTPFNQTSYTGRRVQDQQARTIKDALSDDPSVRSYLMDNGPGFDNVRIRGFPVPSVSTAYGGLYGMLPSVTIMSEMAERVEVLKGPSAMLFGMAPGNASIGGTINVVPKRAPDDGLTQLTANYASAGQFGGHADVARRFGPEKQIGVRFNGVFRAGQTPVNYSSDQRSLAVLGLDFRGDGVRLSADLGYQYQYIGGLTPYLGVNLGVPLPWAPNVKSNPGAQPWAYTDRKDLFGVARAELDLAERVTAYVAFGAHDNRIGGLYPVGINATSFYGAATSTAPINTSQYNTYQTAEGGIRALADTGPIAHELALTATGLWSQTGQNVTQTTTFATNFYNPTIIAPPNLATPAANKTATQDLTTFGIADTLSAAGKRIQLTAGVRLQRVTASNFNVTTGVLTSNYDENAVSPSVALVFKPWENVSVYGNWIQGLQQGTIVGPAFANAGTVFPPFKATQYEAGVKVDWGRFTTTASLFQISQPSILTDVTTNTQFLGGEQVNQGLEINFFGEPVRGVRLLGGLMLLNPVLTKTQGGTTDGWIAPNTPQTNLNLAGEWDLPFLPGLTLNGRVIYTGSQYIDTTFPRRSLPEWTRFDVGMRYAFENPGAKGKLLVARFNVDNVFDANYWAGGNGATNLFLGAPRTFRVSLTADF